MSKLNIGLFSGGPSKEYQVSLNTAAQVAENLDPDKYTITNIVIDREGQWSHNRAELKAQIDFAFIAMHGAYGEDGVLQAILEDLQIPYSGSGVLASSLAMDKFRSTLLALQKGLITPQTWLLGQTKIDLNQLSDNLIFKPNTSGSSEGLKIIKKSEITDFDTFQDEHRGNLLQSRIFGREFTVPVLGDRALPVVEVKPGNETYDYEAKYAEGGSVHVVPAQIEPELTADLQEQALMMHAVLGCEVISRSDFLYVEHSGVYYLETNTIPGMTKTSLLPESAAAAGISFPELLDQIISLSMQK